MQGDRLPLQFLAARTQRVHAPTVQLAACTLATRLWIYAQRDIVSKRMDNVRP